MRTELVELPNGKRRSGGYGIDGLENSFFRFDHCFAATDKRREPGA
jgi:hypothetical protein